MIEVLTEEGSCAQMIYECEHAYYIVDRFCERYRRSGKVCRVNIICTDGL